MAHAPRLGAIATERGGTFRLVNLVTAHDGFTPRDLVSCDHKHNEANGEDNRDGADHDASWSCGVEGPTGEPAVDMTGRVALDGSDALAVRAALDAFVGERGALAWALRGRWVCGHCGARPEAFSWRCAGCRRWATLHMETGIEQAPAPPRERRAAARIPRPAALLGSGPDAALPAPTLDPGLSADELAQASARRSLLGRVATWFSGTWSRDR